MGLEFHEYANFFPVMTDAEYSGLLQNIRDNGLLEPIVIYNGKILDGRNRYRACIELGIELRFEYCDEIIDPLQYVLSKNLHRRHLNESQRAMIAARLETTKQGRQGKDANLHVISRPEAAKMLNVSSRNVATAKQVLEIAPPEVIAEIEAGKLAVSKYARRFTRQKRIQEISTGNKTLRGNGKRYSVILADPPWKYDFTFSDSRAIENQYPTMELEEIMALPVCDITAEHSVIFLWCPPAFNKRAVTVMEAWGFEYRTNMVWVKPSIGPGQWARQRHELLLIGRQGNIPTPESSNRPDSVIEAPREGHSKKPDIVYDLIEKMYPELDRIELFARQQHPGWDVWGNQV